MNSRSTIRKLLLIATLDVILSGCFMTPLALISPAISGFNTTSIIKSGATAGTNHLVKKSTGKTIAEHAITIIDREDIYQQTFVPTYETSIAIILPKSKPIR